MQLLHFCYGLGAFISLWFAKPFLLEINQSKSKQLFNKTIEMILIYNVNDLMIIYSYSIVTISMIICCIVFTFIRLKFQVKGPHPSRITQNEMVSNEIVINSVKKKKIE